MTKADIRNVFKVSWLITKVKPSLWMNYISRNSLLGVIVKLGPGKLVPRLISGKLGPSFCRLPENWVPVSYIYQYSELYILNFILVLDIGGYMVIRGFQCANWTESKGMYIF